MENKTRESKTRMYQMVVSKLAYLEARRVAEKHTVWWSTVRVTETGDPIDGMVLIEFRGREDKKDLILYLISRTLKPIRGPKQFLIRVSEEDASIVSQHKETLTDLLSDDCTLEIFEDPTLSKNQCFIETEDRLLDVSLDVQLKNLSEHLKMLANAL